MNQLQMNGGDAGSVLPAHAHFLGLAGARSPANAPGSSARSLDDRINAPKAKQGGAVSVPRFGAGCHQPCGRQRGGAAAGARRRAVLVPLASLPAPLWVSLALGADRAAQALSRLRAPWWPVRRADRASDNVSDRGRLDPWCPPGSSYLGDDVLPRCERQARHLDLFGWRAGDAVAPQAVTNFGYAQRGTGCRSAPGR